jgi:Kef-type K+ transport system membrane component KefB
LDPIDHVKAFKKAAGISIAGIAVPFACGVGVSKALYDTFMQGSTVAFSTFFVFCGVSMSVTALPILARILADQNIMHTLVGEVALSAAGSDDIISWCLLILVDSFINNPNQQIVALYVFLIVAAYAAFLWICVRPIFVYIVDKSEHENGADEANIAFVFVAMICSAFFTQSAGVDTIFGAFLLGLIVPHDRGFAIALTEKIEDLICIMFLPLYFSFTGLVVNLGILDTAVEWGYVVLVITVACAGMICTIHQSFD